MEMLRALALVWILAASGPGSGRPGDAVPLAGGAIQPHLAADADGDFYCVFIREGNIEFSISTDKGKTWTRSAIAIDAKGKAKGGMQRGPRVAVDGKKTIYVTAPLCFDDAEFSKQYPTQDL